MTVRTENETIEAMLARVESRLALRQRMPGAANETLALELEAVLGSLRRIAAGEDE